MSTLDLTYDLYGSDVTERIVAVEIDKLNTTATVIRRTVEGELLSDEIIFSPFMVLSEKDAVNIWGEKKQLCGPSEVRHHELDAPKPTFNTLVRFKNYKSFDYTKSANWGNGIESVSYSSPVKMFLLGTGRTLFKGMTFNDLHRMQIDIETTGLLWENGHTIFLIACSDNQGREKVFVGDEESMLYGLSHTIREWNPDVLEGHNFFTFDLPFIHHRAATLKVPLSWGRDESELVQGKERKCTIGPNERKFPAFWVWGRHIVDTLLAVQRFDVGRGDLSSYGLKEVAKHYHIAEEDRVYLDRENILALYKSDPERVTKYALQDVLETRSLAQVVCQTEFYQTQMVPDTYQNVCLTGSGEKINSIFVRAYLQRGHAIPQKRSQEDYPGGYTEMRVSGVLKDVVKADVESLYPSIMLSNGITSSSDTLGLFLPLLEDLKQRRLDAKGKMKSAKDKAESDFWDGLQNSFKILINSFYGYLGAPFYFNDYQAARAVTETGQQIVKQIASEMEKKGAVVIEIDTDGVYFQMPGVQSSPDERLQFIRDIGSVLPNGIRLAFDGSYSFMVSLRPKNYILVYEDGKRLLRGVSLRNRNVELYARNFLNQAIDGILQGDLKAVSKLYHAILENLEVRGVHIEEISHRERVTEKTFTSVAKKRNAEALKGLSVGDYLYVYQREGDRALISVDEYKEDYDVMHYRDKLHKFISRLKPAIGDDFDTLFPAPATTKLKRIKELEGRQQLSLSEMFD